MNLGMRNLRDIMYANMKKEFLKDIKSLQISVPNVTRKCIGHDEIIRFVKIAA
jgi:hypothetical protein